MMEEEEEEEDGEEGDEVREWKKIILWYFLVAIALWWATRHSVAVQNLRPIFYLFCNEGSLCLDKILSANDVANNHVLLLKTTRQLVPKERRSFSNWKHKVNLFLRQAKKLGRSFYFPLAFIKSGKT